MKLTHEELMGVLRAEGENVLHAVTRADHAVQGRTVEIIGDFRDQPYGRSKPNLKRKQFLVIDTWYDIGHGFVLRLEGVSMSVGLDKVKFL